MRRDAVHDDSARQTAETYRAAAHDVWRAAGANGALRLTVISDSMRPLLQAGDVAVVQPGDPKALRPGDVIVVQRSGEWITHRLVVVDKLGWHTQGDNTRYLDAAVSADQIVGRVIAIERGSQTIDLQQPHWRAIDRQINRVQRAQWHMSALAHRISGSRSGGLRHSLAAVINWPFQAIVRMLIRF